MPEIRYARNRDVHIAYQVFGDGGVTFVGLPGIMSNIEVIWEDPESRQYLSRLSSFARLVFYDKRGQGMSDRDSGVPTLDERLGDLTAVLDAVGEDRVALGGVSEGGTTAAMFAATYPERVSHLVMYGSFARIDRASGDAFMPRWAQGWGTPQTLSVRAIAPSKIGDLDFLHWINRYQRQSTTPSGVLAGWRWIREMDLRPVLDSIQCPTSSSTERATVSFPSSTAATWQSASPGRAWRSSKATPTHPNGATPRRWCRYCRNS